MCGIVAILRGRSDRQPPELPPLADVLDDAEARLRGLAVPEPAVLLDVAALVREVDRALRGPAGAGALIADPVGRAALDHRSASVASALAAVEARLDAP